MWAHLISAAIGLWLMVAPDVIEYSGRAATMDHIIGPLVASFALVAAWEATRGVRWVNLLLAFWLLLAPLVLDYRAPATVNSMATAVLIGLLSLVRGRSRHSFAGGWSALWRASDTRGTGLPMDSGRPT